MKFSPDLLKAVDHCQHRSFITNRYNGARIAVDCGQCDYCIHKKAQKASMRVRTAGSAFKYSYFVTLTYDNAGGSEQGRTHRQRRNVAFHKNLIVYINIYAIF